MRSTAITISEDAHTPATDERTATRNARSGPLKSEDNNHPSEVESPKSPPSRARPRLQSGAERRDGLENQRESSRSEKIRSSLANNRFLPQRSTAADENTRVPEQDEEPHEQHDLEHDVVEDPTMTALSVLTVVRKKRSAVGASGVDAHDAGPRKLGGFVIATPQPRSWFRLAANHRSKWTQEIRVEEECGLFVQDRRAHLETVHSSTLGRLEERMRREATARAAGQALDTSSSVQLVDLIHFRKPPAHGRHDLNVDDDGGGDDRLVSSSDLDMRKREQTARPAGPSGTTALLEICIDRVVLDDHACFSLEDRIGTQLRSLSSAYFRIQQQQPWQLHLDRVDAYVDAFCSQSDTALEATSWWETQAMNDADQALMELTQLQQLHQQLNDKWNELQECYRQGGRPEAQLYQVKILQRDDPISLTRVQAFIEIITDRCNVTTDESGGTDTDTIATRRAQLAHFTKSEEALQVHDQCLRQVLHLTTPSVAYAVTDANASREPTSSFSLTSSRQRRRPPTLSVVIYINGKQAFATSGRQMSRDSRHPRGLVLFDEIFRVKLPYFPESLSAKVYEQGLIYSFALSATSIPIVLPGRGERSVAFELSRHDQVLAASLAPSREWYQFSSTTPIARTKWHRSFLNSSLYSNFTRHPHGRVCIKAAWIDPNPETEASRGNEPWCFLPPKRPPMIRALLQNERAKVIGSRYTGGSTRTNRRKLDKSCFSYEPDFLVHMKTLDKSLDGNDPDNAAAMCLQEHARARSELQTARLVFRTSSLTAGHGELLGNSIGFVTSKPLTKRNLLLRTRDREHAARNGTSFCEAATCRLNDTITNRGGVETGRWEHEVFEEPVPLEDSVIISDERYLTLLRPEVREFDHRLRVEDAEQEEVYSLERQHKLSLLKIHDFIDRVKQNQLVVDHRSVGREKAKTLASIIQEQPLPLFPGTLDLSGLNNLFAPRRRLRPQATKRSVPNALAEWPTCCNLYIQVQKATNVPVRIVKRTAASPTGRQQLKARQQTATDTKKRRDQDDDTRQQKASDKIRSLKQAPNYVSQIFVEVCFQGKKRRTSSSLLTSSHSANPVWMETLVVPFRPPLDDWSPDSIQRCQDEVRINLFDQVVLASDNNCNQLEARAEDSSTATAGMQQRSFQQENRFLGGLCVPFTTLHHNSGSLEARLRCDMPVEHLGYVNLKCEDGDTTDIETPRSSSGDASPRQAPRSARRNDEADEDGVRKSSREATFVSVMMTLDPLLPLPLKLFEATVASFDSRDASESSKRLAHYAADWMRKTQNTNAGTKQRNFCVFVRNLSNGNTFLTQYLGVQQPPRTGPFSKSRTTLQKLVRFVKLLPFLDDWHLFDGEKDIWSTSQEFLGINAGDHEEHAVLLCNYFRWLDRNDPNLHNYLVVGHAVPEGNGVYVLRQDAYKIPQRSVLWNASTGVGYPVWDERCPMRDVSLVVSSDNIFANVQQVARFQDLTWDVEANAKAWKPFFHPKTVQKDAFTLPCMQTKALAYDATPDEYVANVEMEIRETLKLEIRRWRSNRSTTAFNIDISLRLRRHLEQLERGALGDPVLSEEAHPSASVLLEAQHVKDVSGMPLNTTFTDLHKVVELVKNTVRRLSVRYWRCRRRMRTNSCGQTNSLLVPRSTEHPPERARERRVRTRSVRLRVPKLRPVCLGLLRVACSKISTSSRSLKPRSTGCSTCTASAAR